MRRILPIVLVLGMFGCGAVFPSEPQVKHPANIPVELEDENLPGIFVWELPEEAFLNDGYGKNSRDNVYENTMTEYSQLDDDGEEDVQLYSNVPVKGYLEYTEDSNAIILKKPDKDFVLNLSVPQKLEEMKVSGMKNKLPQTNFARKVYSKSGDMLYSIAPVDTSAVATHGNFSIGTSYNESIDTSDLAFTTSVFTKYETKYLSLTSSYNKNSGVSNSTVVDKFSIAPELKLNDYVSIKDVITSDVTRNRKQNSIILSIKPAKDERIRFEFGAGQTFDENREMIKSEINFSTHFRW